MTQDTNPGLFSAAPLQSWDNPVSQDFCRENHVPGGAGPDPPFEGSLTILPVRDPIRAPTPSRDWVVRISSLGPPTPVLEAENSSSKTSNFKVFGKKDLK